jgi:hypothetical protein
MVDNLGTKIRAIRSGGRPPGRVPGLWARGGRLGPVIRCCSGVVDKPCRLLRRPRRALRPPPLGSGAPRSPSANPSRLRAVVVQTVIPFVRVATGPATTSSRQCPRDVRRGRAGRGTAGHTRRSAFIPEGGRWLFRAVLPSRSVGLEQRGASARRAVGRSSTARPDPGAPAGIAGARSMRATHLPVVGSPLFPGRTRAAAVENGSGVGARRPCSSGDGTPLPARSGFIPVHCDGCGSTGPPAVAMDRELVPRSGWADWT